MRDEEFPGTIESLCHRFRISLWPTNVFPATRLGQICFYWVFTVLLSNTKRRDGRAETYQPTTTKSTRGERKLLSTNRCIYVYTRPEPPACSVCGRNVVILH